MEELLSLPRPYGILVIRLLDGVVTGGALSRDLGPAVQTTVLSLRSRCRT